MKILFKCYVGSRAFGTSTPESDEDVFTIYKCEEDEILGLEYKEHDDVTKDDRRMEIGKFIKLLMNSNPNCLEVLYIPNDCIIEKSREWDEIILPAREQFLTKQLCGTFAGYAKTQIEKAKGLNKKINWEGKRVERKDVLDFCYIYPFESKNKTIPFKTWAEKEQIKQEHCGLIALNHMKNMYELYHDELGWLKYTNHRYENISTHNYLGILKEGANDVHVSSVPEYCIPIGLLCFQIEGYSSHCKDYLSYSKWLEERNENRYKTNKNHKQKYDSKNIMHVVRLLKTARDIAEKGEIVVRRNPEEIEYLLKIKRGEVNLEELVNWAEEEYKLLQKLFDNSPLPKNVDKKFCNELLIKIRKYEKSIFGS